jgi:hypothetical protein
MDEPRRSDRAARRPASTKFGHGSCDDRTMLPSGAIGKEHDSDKTPRSVHPSTTTAYYEPRLVTRLTATAIRPVPKR